MIPKRLVPPEHDDVSIVTNWAAETLPAPYGYCNDHSDCGHHSTLNCIVHCSGHLKRKDSAFDKAMKNPESDLYKVVQTVTATT